MARLTAYEAVRDTLAADPGREFTILELQHETGYSPAHLKRTLERLQESGRATERTPANENTYGYRAPRASSARVPYRREGRCNGCNEFNPDGTVTQIAAGQCRWRLCDLCLSDAGLNVKE
jgi:hypothetical protein